MDLAKEIQKLKLMLKSKKHLAFFIIALFALFIFAPKLLKLISAILIVWLFIKYNNLKYNEDKHSKELKLHFSLEKGQVISGWGKLLVLIGFFYLTVVAYAANMVLEQTASMIDIISSMAYFAFHAIPPTLIITLGFWLIRYSYRYKDADVVEKFVVVEPGQVVISRKFL